MRFTLTIIIIGVVMLTMADHALKSDWQNQCQQTDKIECPKSLWWFL